jgi:hypothetical protein
MNTLFSLIELVFFKIDRFYFTDIITHARKDEKVV